MGSFIERRLFGGSAADYARLEASSAADYDLPHDAPDLERRLPRSAVGRPLETWSIDARSVKRLFGRSTWFRSTSDRDIQQGILDALDLPWDALSVAATCRVDGLDPLAVVQARRFEGAGQDRLRAAAVPADATCREIGGTPAWSVEVRVNPVPPLLTETLGWRVVRGDTVVDIHAPDDEWLEDVVDQVVHGARVVPPSFTVWLPDGWVGVGMADVELESLAARMEKRQPSFAEGLRTYPTPYSTLSATFAAADVDPEHMATFPVHLFVAEYLRRRGDDDAGFAVMHGYASERTGAEPPIRRGRNRAGSWSEFDWIDPGSPEDLTRMAVVIGDPRVLHVGFTTRRADAGRDLPLFDAILASIAFDDTAVPGDPDEDPQPRPGEALEAYLRRVRLLPGEGCTVIGREAPPSARLSWCYVGAGAWDWQVLEGPGAATPRGAAWRLDETTDVASLAHDLTSSLRETLRLDPGEAAHLDCSRQPRVAVERLPGEADGPYLGRALREARHGLGDLIVATADPAHRWPEVWIESTDDHVSVEWQTDDPELIERDWRVRREGDLDVIGGLLAVAIRDRLELPADVPLAAWSGQAWDSGDAPTRSVVQDHVDPFGIEHLLTSTRTRSDTAWVRPSSPGAPGSQAIVRRPLVGGGLTVAWQSGHGSSREVAVGAETRDPEVTVSAASDACRGALGMGVGEDPIVARWLPPEPADPVFFPDPSQGSQDEGTLIWLMVFAFAGLMFAGPIVIVAIVTFVALQAVATSLSLPIAVPLAGAATALVAVPMLRRLLDRQMPPTVQGEASARLIGLAATVGWILVMASTMLAIDAVGMLG